MKWFLIFDNKVVTSSSILGYPPLTAHLIINTENRTGGLVAQGESRDYGYDQRERQG